MIGQRKSLCRTTIPENRRRRIFFPVVGAAQQHGSLSTGCQHLWISYSTYLHLVEERPRIAHELTIETAETAVLLKL